MNHNVHAAPLPATAVDLMTRADAELLAAQFSSEAGERFVHAHLAALRAAAAVLAVRGRPTGRRAVRTVWEMLAGVAPEVEGWSAYFAAGAAGRRAVEAGRADAVDAARAEAVLCAAEDFLDEVRALLDAASVTSPTPGGVGRRQLLSVRAS
ncbi:MAG: colicin transporter [Cellulomonas sp.]|nr:colicin transporter [Cellulomonas sp.]